MNKTHIENRAAAAIRDAFESGRSVLFIPTPEERRVATLVAALGMPVHTWTLTEGIAGFADTREPRAALDFIGSHTPPAVFHLKDFHDALTASADVRRKLRDLQTTCIQRGQLVVITAPVRSLPDDVGSGIPVLTLRQPDMAELEEFLHATAPDSDQGTRRRFAHALLGLTLTEAEYALRRSLGADGTLGPEALRAAMAEKRLIVNRSGTVEVITDVRQMDDIGGLEMLKRWLEQRRKLFELRDDIDEEIVPKGLLMMGMPGCGKSLAVTAIASCFNLPLYRVDMTEIFSGRYGKPENAFVHACHMLEDMSPCILWFDEIERAVTTNESGGEQGRIFGFFLTWMQEKKRGLFVAATANRIELLPPEMIRKGRFDEVFFVDLPSEEERLSIFRIHLKRRGLDPASYELNQLLEFTQGWAGAEIEQCVVSAITRAKLEDRELTDKDLVQVAVSIVPLSRTMKEQMNLIRNWAFERAVRASAGRHGTR